MKHYRPFCFDACTPNKVILDHPRQRSFARRISRSKTAIAVLLTFGVVPPATATQSNPSVSAQAKLERACDVAAASKDDRSRPPGIAGVDADEIDVKAAVSVCQAALINAPENPRLLYQIARVLYIGKDYVNARLFATKATLLSHASAQVLLGVMHRDGKGGLKPDPTTALRLFRLAADQNNASGQENLGWFYEVGRGGLEKDEPEAARLYKLAADQGSDFAQFSLGRMYRDGTGGLTKSDKSASYYFKLAAAQGSEDAKAALEKLKAQEEADAKKQKEEKDGLTAGKIIAGVLIIGAAAAILSHGSSSTPSSSTPTPPRKSQDNCGLGDHMVASDLGVVGAWRLGNGCS